jgi:hypothetical protein
MAFAIVTVVGMQAGGAAATFGWPWAWWRWHVSEHVGQGREAEDSNFRGLRSMSPRPVDEGRRRRDVTLAGVRVLCPRPRPRPVACCPGRRSLAVRVHVQESGVRGHDLIRGKRAPRRGFGKERSDDCAHPRTLHNRSWTASSAATLRGKATAAALSGRASAACVRCGSARWSSRSSVWRRPHWPMGAAQMRGLSANHFHRSARPSFATHRVPTAQSTHPRHRGRRLEAAAPTLHAGPDVFIHILGKHAASRQAAQGGLSGSRLQMRGSLHSLGVARRQWHGASNGQTPLR